MKKMTERKSFFNTKFFHSNEDRFNNYDSTSATNRSIDFHCSLPRNIEKLKAQPSKTIDVDRSLKAENKNKFNEAIFKCLFDYEKAAILKEEKHLVPLKIPL